MNAYFTFRNLFESKNFDLNESFDTICSLIKHPHPVIFRVLIKDDNNYDSWTMETNEKKITKDDSKDPDFQILTTEDIWKKIVIGQIAPLKAFRLGKLRVAGNYTLAIQILSQLKK